MGGVWPSLASAVRMTASARSMCGQSSVVSSSTRTADEYASGAGEAADDLVRQTRLARVALARHEVVRDARPRAREAGIYLRRAIARETSPVRRRISGRIVRRNGGEATDEIRAL